MTTTTRRRGDARAEADRRLMSRALELAARGIGFVSPSPLVGCVIAADDGRVVGEGFYLYDGLKHAEALALEQAGPLARGATAYVTLEPHAHQSRTPPCTDALIRAGVRRVVYSVDDPNSLVAGNGLRQLRAAGVEVEVGLMALEAALLNEKYLHAVREGRPFVHLKLACSLDGRIQTHARDSCRMTGPEARTAVHELRHEYDAVLVGAGTAEKDDPALKDRSGRRRRRPLVRVVLGKTLRLSPTSRLARTAREAPVLVFTAEVDGERADALRRLGVEIVRAECGGRNLAGVLEELCHRSLQSVLVEGGGTVAGAFRDAGLIDKVSFFIAPRIIGGREAVPSVGGFGADCMARAVDIVNAEVRLRGRDVEVTGYPEAAQAGRG